MATGVYVIKHRSGVFYIGSAADLIKRRDEHNSRLRNNGHHCTRLQSAYNANSDLVWEYHFTTTREEAYALEKEMIEQHVNDPDLVNKVHAGWKPEFLPKAIEISAELRRGIKLTDVHKANISAGLLKAVFCPEKLKAKAEKRKKPVIVDGVRYAGAKEAAKLLNMVATTLTRRCRNHDPKFAAWQMAPCEEV